MNLNLLILALLVSSSTQAHKVFEGDIRHSEDVTLIAGEEYTVPSCRKLMLKDVKRYNDSTWLRITGGVEIRSVVNGRESGVHVLEGTFTYATKSGKFDESVSALPGSKVVLFSKSQVTTMAAMEYSWVFEKDSTCWQ